MFWTYLSPCVCSVLQIYHSCTKSTVIKVLLWELIPFRNTDWYNCFPCYLGGQCQLPTTVEVYLTVKLKSFRNKLHHMKNFVAKQFIKSLSVISNEEAISGNACII